MLVPLYGFLSGDTLGLVILVQDHDRIRQVVATLEEAACMRVTPAGKGKVYFKGRLLDLNQTVAEAGLTALDYVHVVQERA